MRAGWIPSALTVLLMLGTACNAAGGASKGVASSFETASAAQGPYPASPEVCTEVTEELETLYRELQVCEVDSDCHYVDGFYDVIQRQNTTGFVRTFDCNVISPLLVVANATELRREWHELLQLQREQEEACRPEGEVAFCQAFDGFETNQPPVCVSGRCQASIPPTARFVATGT